MANYKTGAQRYNDRMDKIFEESKRLNMKYHGKDAFGSSKGKALVKKTESNKLYKTHHSTEYCRHCGEKISTSTRHESGHREYDHERTRPINEIGLK